MLKYKYDPHILNFYIHWRFQNIYPSIKLSQAKPKGSPCHEFRM